MPQEDDGTSKLHHPEKILWVIFPANDDTTKIMKPCEQALDFPAPPVTTQYATVLRRGFASSGTVRSDQLHTEALANLHIQWVTVIRTVADQSLGSFGEEALLDRGFDECCFMRRSAGHVHGERKTMAVADRHDFAAFAAASRADSRAPFLAELKLASMNDSLRFSLPRSRKSSASFSGAVPAIQSAATVGSGDDRFDKADSDAADRAKARRCAKPNKHRSAPLAYLATVDLAHLSAASDGKAARESPIGRR